MAKSMRCKREKRLRALRREMVEPYYEKKDEAKLAAQEAALAALAAPKLPVKSSSKASSSMDVTPFLTSKPSDNDMEVEMADGSQTKSSLKPFGGVSKKSQRVFKVGKRRCHGKGKRSQVKRRHI